MNKVLHSTLLLSVSVLLAACKAEAPPRDVFDQQLAEKLPLASYETRQKVREVLRNTLTNLAFIEGGTFTMGDWGAVGEDGVWRPYFPPTAQEDKAHQVTLSNYSLGKYETTWEEYDTFLLATGRSVVRRATNLMGEKIEERPREPYQQDPERSTYIKKPAKDRWQDAKDYCQWLEVMTGLAFALPTDAQFEYAARNRGKKWLYPTYNGKTVGDNDPLYKRLDRFGTAVGTQLPANPLGLYDIGENAKEWVNDWYSPAYYSENPEITDPNGPTIGTEKIVRSLGVGGSLSFSFSRISQPEKYEDGYLVTNGFRCAVNSPTPVTMEIPK